MRLRKRIWKLQESNVMEAIHLGMFEMMIQVCAHTLINKNQSFAQNLILLMKKSQLLNNSTKANNFKEYKINITRKLLVEHKFYIHFVHTIILYLY